jgi:hypothetical protein
MLGVSDERTDQPRVRDSQQKKTGEQLQLDGLAPSCVRGSAWEHGATRSGCMWRLGTVHVRDLGESLFAASD